jgi:hypothetical protein
MITFELEVLLNLVPELLVDDGRLLSCIKRAFVRDSAGVQNI